jgi:hypothetical protein
MQLSLNYATPGCTAEVECIARSVVSGLVDCSVPPAWTVKVRAQQPQTVISTHQRARHVECNGEHALPCHRPVSRERICRHSTVRTLSSTTTREQCGNAATPDKIPMSRESSNSDFRHHRSALADSYLIALRLWRHMQIVPMTVPSRLVSQRTPQRDPCCFD